MYLNGGTVPGARYQGIIGAGWLSRKRFQCAPFDGSILNHLYVVVANSIPCRSFSLLAARQDECFVH